jgi:hypothetical protein
MESTVGAEKILGGAERSGFWDRRSWGPLGDAAVALVYAAAPYVCFVFRVFNTGLDGLTGPLPDGSPSGVSVVDPVSLACAVAYSWWHPSVCLARFLVPRQMIGCPPKALSPRLEMLIDSAAARLGKPSANSPGLLFVFDHGPAGVRLSRDRSDFRIPVGGALKVRRGSPLGGRRPSVLAASVGGVCVTRVIGRITNIPDEDAAANTVLGAPEGSPPLSAADALLAYLAAYGIPKHMLRAAGAVAVAPRGSPRVIEYAFSKRL